MPNKQVEKVQKQANTVFDTVTGTAHKFFQVGLGAAAMAQEGVVALIDNSESFANKLVERGETTEKDGRKMVNEFVEPYQKQAKDRSKQAEKRFNEFSESTLNRLNIPSASNIEDLNKKVASLSRKVDQLKKAQES